VDHQYYQAESYTVITTESHFVQGGGDIHLARCGNAFIGFLLAYIQQT